MPAEVPVARLLKNVTDYVRAHPGDAQGYYTLGRIQSAAFALDTDKLRVFERDALPAIAHYPNVTTPRNQAGSLSRNAITLLTGSISNYKRATQLDAGNALAWLGLGFECEEALRFPAALDRVVETPAFPSNHTAGSTSDREGVRSQALRAYRRAYSLSITSDLNSGGFGPPVSQEAAEGILRLQKQRQLTERERAEVALLNAKLKALKSMVRPVTPILLSLQGAPHLTDLLAPGSSVHFDLSGEGNDRAWPWVKPTTGILVWDPHHTGRITSGLQLFGSVTWWLFWRDGYAPLAALDNDHDGWLEGRELDGIAVWFDRNGNGVADPGEVVSLASLGIRRIAVRATGHSANALCNRQGIQFRDGSYGATFDWTPTSLR
jgi:hypothetical protein